jgi:adenylate cyclase class 2
VYEVELKVRTAHEPVRDALADRGISLGSRIGQADTYYDAPTRDFAETDEALRLRRMARMNEAVNRDVGAAVTAAVEEGQTTLTYKGPRLGEGSKTREEIETSVGDGDAVATMLTRVGFEEVATVRKIRERATIDAMTITLDTVAGLGEFVEVERTVSEDEIDAARSAVEACMAELGLDPSAGIRTSYLGLQLDV